MKTDSERRDRMNADVNKTTRHQIIISFSRYERLATPSALHRGLPGLMVAPGILDQTGLTMGLRCRCIDGSTQRQLDVTARDSSVQRRAGSSMPFADAVPPHRERRLSEIKTSMVVDGFALDQLL
jgi:hypothetical protein